MKRRRPYLSGPWGGARYPKELDELKLIVGDSALSISKMYDLLMMGGTAMFANGGKIYKGPNDFDRYLNEDLNIKDPKTKEKIKDLCKKMAEKVI